MSGPRSKPANLAEQHTAALELYRLAAEGAAPDADPVDVLKRSVASVMSAYVDAQAAADVGAVIGTAVAALMFAGFAGELAALLPVEARSGVIGDLSAELLRGFGIDLKGAIAERELVGVSASRKRVLQ